MLGAMNVFYFYIIEKVALQYVSVLQMTQVLEHDDWLDPVCLMAAKQEKKSINTSSHNPKTILSQNNTIFTHN